MYIVQRCVSKSETQDSTGYHAISLHSPHDVQCHATVMWSMSLVAAELQQLQKHGEKWHRTQTAAASDLTSPGSHRRGSPFTACARTAGTLSCSRRSKISCMSSSRSASSSSAVSELKMTCTSWQHLVRTALSLAVTSLTRNLRSFSANVSQSAGLSMSLSARNVVMNLTIRSPLNSTYRLSPEFSVRGLLVAKKGSAAAMSHRTVGVNRTCCRHCRTSCKHC